MTATQQQKSQQQKSQQKLSEAWEAEAVNIITVAYINLAWLPGRIIFVYQNRLTASKLPGLPAPSSGSWSRSSRSVKASNRGSSRASNGDSDAATEPLIGTSISTLTELFPIHYGTTLK
ncbi:uncharacterized protein ANIA_00663 [Aspergillus nidulans FGSC A4]|uniref:Uncharacterized protein n=1 Tax=Emericella nidulans (strain FGSC A4 / ATCC 38163 / CBS 112.46 / NRRL 194 / M139) TaxID=227321 RepID=C8VRT3_EMENI|nr:hypothetical protein [Aspergillus nidulans FGSC A4]CBF89033.1 TPA: hypothetical protein ANIA_00663 [Aspergillus nidulans FGSC A4]